MEQLKCLERNWKAIQLRLYYNENIFTVLIGFKRVRTFATLSDITVKDDYVSTSVAGSLAIVKADPFFVKPRGIGLYPLFRSVQVQIADIRRHVDRCQISIEWDLLIHNQCI